MSAAELRLKIELIPRPLWGRNLRLSDRPQWRVLRKKLAGDSEPGCAICGKPEGQLQGHEEWEYIERKKSGIARLRGVNLVCQDCHSIHHIGRTQRLLLGQGETGRIEWTRLIAHFLRVNQCDGAAWAQHSRQAKADWERRSKIINWTVDFGVWGLKT